jgi:hypothetical protein
MITNRYFDIESSKSRSKWEADFQRRLEAAKYIDFLNNEQLPHTIEHLTTLFPNTIEQIKHYIKIEFLTSQLIDKLSIMFQEDPVIVVDGIADSQQDSLDAILDRVKLISFLDFAQQLANNYLKVAIMPRWDSKRKETYLHLITPDEMIVVQDSDRPQIADAVLINIGILENTHLKAEYVNRYMYIDSDVIYECELNSETGKIYKKCNEQKNRYGRIPIAFFSVYPCLKSFWGDKKNDIIETNLFINEHKTDLSIMIHYQAFSTLVRKGNAEWLAEVPVKFGPQFSVDIATDPLGAGDQETDVKYITPSVEIESVSNYIDKEIIKLAQAHGISARAYRGETGEANSGYSIKLSMLDLIKRNINQRKHFEEPIKELIRHIMATEQIAAEGVRFGSLEQIYNRDIDITFGDITIEEDPTIELDNDIKAVAGGFASPVDIIMKRYPNLTEEEAKDKYEEIIAIKQGRQREPDQIDRMIDEL